MGIFKKSKNGFTSLEILSSTVLVSMLSVASMPSLINLEKEAKLSVVQGVVGATRTSLELQRMQIIIRCGGSYNTKLHADQLNANDITYGNNAPCDSQEVIQPKERRFLTEKISANPFNKNNRIANCKLNNNNPCNSIDTTQAAGWCYDSESDKFWANSNTSGECAY